MLEPRSPGRVEQHVEDGTLGGRKQHFVDKGFVLITSTITADQF
jgi:hypothetical protein